MTTLARTSDKDFICFFDKRNNVNLAIGSNNVQGHMF